VRTSRARSEEGRWWRSLAEIDRSYRTCARPASRARGQWRVATPLGPAAAGSRRQDASAAAANSLTSALKSCALTEATNSRRKWSSSRPSM
jgi:hypothetical protein